MEIKKNKELYEAPSTRVFEVKIEGVICQSLPEGALQDPNDYGGQDNEESIWNCSYAACAGCLQQD